MGDLEDREIQANRVNYVFFTPQYIDTTNIHTDKLDPAYEFSVRFF